MSNRNNATGKTPSPGLLSRTTAGVMMTLLAAAAIAGPLVTRRALELSALKRGASPTIEGVALEIKSGLPPSSQFTTSLAKSWTNANVEQDENGRIRRVRGYVPVPGAKSAPEAARTFLQERRAFFQLADGLPELQQTSAVESQGGHHVTYTQVYQGLPVFQGRVSVHTDRTYTVQTVNFDLIPITNIVRVARPQNPQGAIQAVIAASKAQPHSTPTAEPFVFVDKGTPRSVWKVNYVSHRPAADFEALVDAQTGRVLRLRNIACYVDGTGMVFNPDPVSTTGNAGLVDNSNADSTTLTGQRSSVTLPGLDGAGRLTGTYCTTAPSSSINRAFSASNTFNFTRSQDGFEETMVYYHIDKTVRYILSLGFTNVQNRQTGVNVNGITDDNSFYSLSSKQITFGTGGVDDAEDAHIILHEFGHSIHDNQVPGWGNTVEGGAMGEGFGDYWAAQGYAGIGPNSPAWDVYVGKWDGVSYNPGNPAFLRRVDSSKHYPEDRVNQVHADGEMWSACLWQLHQLVGRDRANRLILESHFSVSPSGNFADGSNAIVTANQNLYSGADQAAIRQIFVDRGFIESLAKPTNLNASVFSSNRVDLTWVDNSPDEQGFRIERRVGGGAYALLTTVGANVASYQDTTVVANTDYAYRVRAYNAEGNSGFSNEALATTPDQTYSVAGRVSGISGINGVTVQATGTASQLGSFSRSPGTAILDNSTFDDTLNVGATGTLTNIKVSVNITHTYIGDLVVTVIAPDGTAVRLHNRTGGSTENIVTTYPTPTTPNQALTALNNKQINGAWKLRVADQAGQDEGTLNSWSLTLTYNGTVTRTATTNSSGDYSIANLPTATYTVQASKAGLTFSPASQSVNVTNNVSNVQFTALASIAGTVNLGNVVNKAQPLTFECRPDGGGAATTISQTLTSAGGFTLAGLPAGTYTVHVNGDRWVAKNVVVNAASSVTNAAVTLIPGDITGDESIDLFDLVALFDAYGAQPGDSNWNALADLNCDGNDVDLFDLVLLFDGYGEEGDP